MLKTDGGAVDVDATPSPDHRAGVFLIKRARGMMMFMKKLNARSMPVAMWVSP